MVTNKIKQMNAQEKIEKLQEEINKMREEERARGKEKYACLTGRYFRTAYTSREKVISIDRADEYEVAMNTIEVYLDERTSESRINSAGWLTIPIEDIERYETTKEEFENAFEKAIKLIREKLEA